MCKYVVFFVLMILAYLGLGHWYYWQTGDFRSSNLLVASSSSSEILPPKKIELIKKVLDQSYTYLGHGNQTYVFASQDGEYVLKLFMKDYLTRTWLKHIFPPVPPFRSYLLYQGERQTYRMDRLINGYRYTYLYDPEDSGLIYLHVGPSEFIKEVFLVDGLGRSSIFPLNSYFFVLQKRAVPARKEFLRLIANRDIEGLKSRLKQLFSLYFRQMERGLYDEDHNLIDNTGFIKDRAIRQDAGKVVYGEKYRNLKMIRKELKGLTTNRLIPWFRRNAPTDAEELNKWMEGELGR